MSSCSDAGRRRRLRSLDGGTVIRRQHNGPRVYDINTDGVAHFGLFPDWWERLRLTAGRQVATDLSALAEAYLEMWERAAGVRSACLPGIGRFHARGLGEATLGRGPVASLKRVGQPLSRPKRAFVYCAGSARLSVVFGRSRRATLVATTSQGHRLHGVAPGMATDAVRDAGAPPVAPGIFVRGLGESSAAVYVVAAGRVRVVAVVRRDLADRLDALRQTLRLSRL